MRKKWATAGFLRLLVFGAGLCPAFAGNSLYGKVTEVKSADVVVLDYGAGQYTIRIAGIEAPKQGRLAQEAKESLARLVHGRAIIFSLPHCWHV